jgi:DNA-binding NarL/FixJ family response regulator
MANNRGVTINPARANALPMRLSRTRQATRNMDGNVMNERPSGSNQDVPRRVRILIADDHDIVREGLRKILDGHAHWVLCGEAQNGRQVVNLCQEMKPDIAILDISMPELNGVDACLQVRKVSPATEILVFTMHDSEHLVRSMLAAGARGYLLKSDPAQTLIEAVASLAAHRPYFNAHVSETILSGYLHAMAQEMPSSPERGASLTGREREVLQLLAEGRPNKEVARRLGVGVKTVETHRFAIMRKIGANSIVDVVLFAIRNHIVDCRNPGA